MTEVNDVQYICRPKQTAIEGRVLTFRGSLSPPAYRGRRGGDSVRRATGCHGVLAGQCHGGDPQGDGRHLLRVRPPRAMEVQLGRQLLHSYGGGGGGHQTRAGTMDQMQRSPSFSLQEER